MVFWNKVQGSVQYFPEVGATQKVGAGAPYKWTKFSGKKSARKWKKFDYLDLPLHLKLSVMPSRTTSLIAWISNPIINFIMFSWRHSIT